VPPESLRLKDLIDITRLPRGLHNMGSNRAHRFRSAETRSHDYCYFAGHADYSKMYMTHALVVDLCMYLTCQRYPRPINTAP